MSREPKVDYGDTVRVTGKEHSGRLGAVVGISCSALFRTYTVEFGDGSDDEIDEDCLYRVNE